MPARLRPTTPIAPEAILVGDPGRALLLAQALLEAPKMSNHARGLWGYFGKTEGGRPLTIQATGMGGPSAALVLGDLFELGVRRAVRVGSCTALDPSLHAGDLLGVAEAHAWGGAGAGAVTRPDPGLTAALRERLGEEARWGAVASLDVLHRGGGPPPVAAGEVTDMQTSALLAAGAELGVALGAVLIVAETSAGEQLDDEAAEAAAKRAGLAAAAVLSA